MRERREVSMQRSHQAHRVSRAAQRAALAIVLVRRTDLTLLPTGVPDAVRIDIVLTSVG